MKKCLAILGVMAMGVASGSTMAADGNPWRTGQAAQPSPYQQDLQNQQYRQQPPKQEMGKYPPLNGDATHVERNLSPSQNPATVPGYPPSANMPYAAPMGTGLGYPGYAYPGLGYPGMGYSGLGYPGLGYPGTGLGGYPYGYGNSWPGLGGFNGPLSIMPFW